MRWVLKPLVFVVCLLPLGIMVWQGLHDGLGANPIEELTHRTGDWTLRLLLITLAVTPLRQTLGWTQLMRLRRMLGLYAFFYATLHFTIYLWLDQFFDWGEIAADIVKRPYITVGFAAFVLLIPLAATSTQGMMRRLRRHWVRLHRAVYVIAILGVMHFWWLVKADVREPAVYAALLTLLLGYRLLRAGRGRAPAARLAHYPHASTRNP
jgi:sulfoxide reductase heme-binding subunit YedZ